MTVVDPTTFLSHGARAFQESAIRRAGTLAGRVPGLVPFAAGAPDPALFPWDALRAIADALLSARDAGTLQYGATRGYRPLIEAILTRLAAQGVSGRAEEMLVTSGSQQGLDMAARVLLDPGDVVLVERPTYSGAIAAFRNHGAALVDVVQDDEGMVPDALADTVARLRARGRRPRAIYVTPNFQNPGGTLMSLRRRGELLDGAARAGLAIIEDDPYGSLYFDEARAGDTRPMKADDVDGRVVYLGSFSKTLAPGLRTAWMLAPPPIAHHVELAKQAADISTGVFDQRLVHQALVRGVVDALGPTLRATYRARRDAMEAALRAALGDRLRWRTPQGGFFLWVEAPAGTDTEGLFDAALAEGVSFVPGSAFFAGTLDGAPVSGQAAWLRLAYSAVPPDRIQEGVARLARVLGAR